MVVAIIGLLATIVMISSSGVREKRNNARRIEDMRSVHTALISYYYKATPYYYPNDGANSLLKNVTDLATTYIQKIPENPDPVDVDYVYKTTTADCDNSGSGKYCKDFILCADLEPAGVRQKVFCCNKGGCKEGTTTVDNQKCDDLTACP